MLVRLDSLEVRRIFKSVCVFLNHASSAGCCTVFFFAGVWKCYERAFHNKWFKADQSVCVRCGCVWFKILCSQMELRSLPTACFFLMIQCARVCVFCAGQPQCVPARMWGVGTERLAALRPWRPAGHVDTPHCKVRPSVRLKSPVCVCLSRCSFCFFLYSIPGKSNRFRYDCHMRLWISVRQI